MYNYREIKLPPYVVPYSNRKKFCRKVRETLKMTGEAKSEGDWYRAAYLKWKLRKSWWGYKRYK